MIHALVTGRRFRVGTSGMIYYNKRFTNPFRFEHTHIGVLIELFDQDIWTEIKPNYPLDIKHPYYGGNNEIR
jgi:hypothetical protein